MMHSHRKRFLVLSLLFFALAGIERANAGPLFSTTDFFDPNTGNTEHRFLADGFHFGTLIVDPPGRLIFRPHPDQGDPNGFGTSWFMNPFLAGADPGRGMVNTINPGSVGINLDLSGQVNRAGGLTYGTWQLQGLISYDPAAQRVFGSGAVNILLDNTLAAAGADLNVERLSSNFLHNVPLQTGGIGDTGDMSRALVKYAPNGDPKDFVWYPPALPVHFPFDFSNYIDVDVLGQLNAVDTLALGEGFQIAIARKPTLDLIYASAGDPMIVGLTWDQSQGQNFAADNVGINHLFIQGRTSATNLPLSFQFESTVPVPEPSTATLFAIGLLVLTVRLWGGFKQLKQSAAAQCKR